MPEMVAYDEFAYFHDNASEFNIAWTGPPIVRRERVSVGAGRELSALVWGTGEPEYVLIHGGAQNAHTWDTVALALGRPLLAVDLPGHGHSDGADLDAGPIAPHANALDVAHVVRTLAPHAKAVAGMSLGGLTAIALAGLAPELVRRLVLVDITPGVTGPKSAAISNFINGPATFASFDEILARTIEHNSTRTVASLRRGILHNAVQEADGSWVWRYRRHPGAKTIGAGAITEVPKFGDLWDVLGAVTCPTMLVRGMRPQSVVDDADETELIRRLPGARVEHLEEAGHSVQGDTPLEFASLLADFAGMSVTKP